MSRQSDVPLWKLRKGFLNKIDWQYITEAATKMCDMPIYIDFSSRKVSQIEKTILTMVEKHQIKLLIIDYLQLADAEQVKGRNRAEEVAATSRILKHTAKQYKIPVIALAQLNRDIDKRPNKKPMLSDLKESGQIEQDADVIIFLYEGKNPNTAILDFQKGRNQGSGEITLFFNKEKMFFGNYKKQEKTEVSNE